ncbi:uncharacterized protein LOC105442568 [Strongylocentrotus purpuratus]|uniref:Hyalin n=1 Tax=Strongylocentrotus purpuratus TaxID=7668 RepID=A0A7M7NS59_STRPU|nr:uncharacterized protein LOC105442568 [Strongylocentrotus purpuratus]
MSNFNHSPPCTADTTSPVFSNCPSTVTVQLPIGQENSTATWTPPTALDNDGQPNVDSTRSPEDVFGVGISHVVYTATDDVGLQATCDFNVILTATEDHVPPVISDCPFSVVAKAGNPGDPVTWNIPTAVDNGVSVPLSNRSDTVAPTLTTTCPTSDVFAIAEPGVFTATATWTPPSATDDRTFQNDIIVIATNNPGDSFGEGTTPVTYVFMDQQGNSVMCQFNVVFVPDPNNDDPDPPGFTECPSNVVVAAPFGAASAVVTWTEPTANASDGQPTVTSINNPGGHFPIGVTAITYTAIDMSGLQAFCTFNVIVRAGVVDNIDPVLTCPDFIPQLVELGTATVELSFDDPTIMDESNTATLSSRSHEFPFNFSVSEQTIVTFSAMDQTGNVGSCSFSVFLISVDTISPAVTCPDTMNLTVELGQLFLDVSFPNATATDVSDVTLLNQSHVSGDMFPVGVTTIVSFVFQDESSNRGECSFPITVDAVDTTPPNVTCPSTLFETVELGSNGTVLTIPNDTATATDISGIPTLLSISPSSGSMFAIGPTLVTIVYTDTSDNLGNCTLTVNVTTQDTTPPMLTCPVDIFETIELGQGPRNVSFDDPAISDASNTEMILSRSHNSSSLFPAGVITTVTFTAGDESGNEDSCSFTVLIMEVDSTDPVLTCPPDNTAEAQLGLPTLPVSFDNPSITDDSNTAIITSSSHTSPGPFTVGETTRVTFTARDESGNEGSCSFNINVNTIDSTDPVLTCPPNINMTIELGPTNVPITFPDPIVFDFADTSLITSHSSPGPFPVDATTVVTFTATDQSSNQGTCSFSIDFNIVDRTAPTVTCPTSITRIVDSPQSAMVTFDNATATDLSNMVMFISQSHQSGSMFTFGLSIVTFTFEDNSGNTGSCELSITVDTDQCLSSPCINGACIDNVNSFNCVCEPGFDGPICDTADTTPPVVTCPRNIERTVEVDDQGPFQVTFDDATAMDTSGVVNLLNRSHDSGDDFPIGQSVVSFVFGDASGNFIECSFLVSINAVDETPPTPSCSDDLVETVESGVSGKRVTFELVTATDNSGNATLVTHSPVSGSLFPVGSTPVIFIFTDAAGNRASCFFLINVTEVDMTPPEATCPENVTAIAQSGASYAAVTFTPPEATDNSGMTSLVGVSSASGSNFTLGTTIVTATFEDPSGNIGTCSFTVVVSGENSTVTVSDLGTDFFELTWTNDVNMGISAYTIILSDADGIVLPTRSFAPSPIIIQRFEQLTPGTQYMIDIDSFISTPVDFAALNVVTRPKRVENVTVYELSDSSYFFRWDPPSLPDNFFIDYILRSNSSVSAADEIRFLPPRKSYGLGGLMSGAQYIFEFFTGIGPTLSGSSDLLEIPLGTQAGMNIRAITAQELEVSGNPPSAMTQVKLFSEDGLEEHERTIEPGNISLVFTELQPDTVYTMIAVSEVMVVSSETRRTNLLDGISSTTVTSDSVELTWTAVPTATSYEISYISQDTTTAEVMSIPTSQSMALVSNLQPQTLYTFSVVAANGSERTNVGSVSTATGTANQPPVLNNCPNDTSQVLPDTSSFVSVSWTPPTGVDDTGTPQVSSTNQPGSMFEYGLTIVTYTAMDSEGLSVNCSFVVNVTDTTLPVISMCPSTALGLLMPEDSMVQVFWPMPMTGDNSGLSTLMSTHNPGDSFPLGETTVTYTAVDAAGNMVTCIFNVSVAPDSTNQPPVLSDCPMDVPVTLTSTSSNVTATWTPPNATDDNDTPVLSTTHEPGSMFGFGSTIVTYTATDSENLTDTCNFTVVVGDNTEPDLTDCPVVDSLVAPQGSSMGRAFWDPPTAEDNSAMVTVSSSHSSGDTFPIGPTDVVYTATDAAGNNATCNFTVVVRAFPDDPIRLVDCPLGANGTLPMLSDQVQVTWVPPTVAGGVGETTLISDVQPDSLFRYGEREVTYTATDSDSFTISCSFLVVVADVTDPMINGCPMQVTGEVPQGSTEVSVTWTMPTADDNSGMYTFTPTRQPNDQFRVGIFEVVYTATDQAGNSALCSFQVNVTQASGGTPGPMFDSCPSSVSGTLPSSSSQVAVSWTVPMVTAGTGTATVNSNHQPGDLFGVGLISVLYEAIDSGGLMDSCSFEVIITDMFDPIISECPAGATAVVPQGSTNVSAYWISPKAEDNSEMVTLTSESSPGDVFPVGSFQVVYTARDTAGNTASCRFLVNVTMSTGEINPGPELMNCPSDVDATLPPTSSEVAVTWEPPTATDDASTPIVTSDREPGNMFGFGSTTVTYTARDSQGVGDTCSFIVQIGDLNNPVILGCPTAGVTGVLPPGSSTVPVSWAEPTQMDNSGMSTFMSTHIPGSPFREGTTEVLYTAEDIADNSAECSFIVTVTSSGVINPPPVISNCPSRILGALLPNSDKVSVSWTAPTATDNTGTPTLISNIQPGSLFSYGITTVTYMAEDDGGAVATCSFNVQVQDVTRPVISGCPFSASGTLLPGATTVAVTWTPPTQMDNSGISSLTSSHAPGTMFPAGETEVTYTAIDTPGNTAQCSFIVTVTLLSAVRCIVPAVTPNLNSIGDQCNGPVAITFNARCNFQCDSGYTVVGDASLSCGMDGMLVGTFPTCQETNECRTSTPCGDPNSFCLNTIGSYTCQCNEGYQRDTDDSCRRLQGCSVTTCQNSGNCVDGSNGPVCQCPNTFTGSLCQIDLACGTVTCHSSQACANGQCVCPEGTQFLQGQCQDECSVSCDQFTETCDQTSNGFTCSCRPNTARSYWTDQCIIRVRMFIVRFAITRIGLQPVDFNPNYANQQSAEYIAAASAIQNLLPQILLAQGVRGIINVGVGRFFLGSLMAEVNIPVSDEFTGDANTIRDAIASYLSSNLNNIDDGTHQLEIQPQIQAEETTVVNECADSASNDCSINSICINDETGVGYTCDCRQGFLDLYPNTLPGRNCVTVVTDINECSSSTACSDVNSFCLNTIGSFLCVCNEGYELATDGGCQARVRQCSIISCRNSGTCSVGTTEPVCNCSTSFAGPACEIDLRCGTSTCHISQVCSNGQCTCPEGTELFLGSCRDQCSPSCEVSRETCIQTTTVSHTCECRASRDRSYLTNQCLTRAQEFFIRFVISEIGISAVDFNVQFSNEQSQEYQAASVAVSNLLPRVLLAQGIRGIINVGVQRFFSGSLGAECRVPVSADFVGDENTILAALRSYLGDNDNTVSDGSFRLEIPGDSVTSTDADATTRMPVQTGGAVSEEVNIGLIAGIVAAVLLLIIIVVIGICIVFARFHNQGHMRRKITARPEDYGTDDLMYRLAASVPNVYFQRPGSIENTSLPPLSPPQGNNPSPQKAERKRRKRKGPFFHHPA